MSSRRPARQSGQSLVELAVVLPFLLLLVGVGVDFSRIFFGGIQVTDAAREASLYLTKHHGDVAGAQTMVSSTTSNGGAAFSCSSTPVVTATEANDPNDAAVKDETVVVTCTVTRLTPFVPLPSGMTLKATVTSAYVP